ncbi:nuclease EXOG, mitochondrial isoform X1 [Ambystoma mexicanum]|uniref:nuclease EXOG, mitochondrial isoform X1 n=1 Tax=Ambystoma mexicanum TaxID=8296 RepID=UPI0037E77C4F
MVGVFGKRLASRRFLSGFVLGAAVSTASCLTAVHLFLLQEKELHVEPPPEPSEDPVIKEYGFPVTGAEVRHYANHALSYDQERRIPRWVIEHISKSKIVGSANRGHCKFKRDPNVPAMFSAANEDYLRSGWSRGHMAPAGDNKFSLQAMAETFYLSNIVPQNYENNAGFWNRMEMYCRDLTAKFDDVWVVSGPLVLPQTEEDGKRKVTYTVIGKDDVAVPSHLFKVILARKSTRDNEPLVLGAFVVPNSPISFSHQLPEFQVDIEELEKMSGLMFFPRLDKKKDFKNICEVHHCKLMDFAEFTLYISGRKVQSAKTTERLEKVLSELEESGVQPDEYLLNLYKKKMNEMLQEQKVPAERKSG